MGMGVARSELQSNGIFVTKFAHPEIMTMYETKHWRVSFMAATYFSRNRLRPFMYQVPSDCFTD